MHNRHSHSVYLLTRFQLTNVEEPDEERMVRMALEDLKPAVTVEYDADSQVLSVYHRGNLELITQKIGSLDNDAHILNTETIDRLTLWRVHKRIVLSNIKQANVLKWLLIINGGMFIVEIIVGWIAQSTGLIADSLDMLADAMVYALALYAVGHSIKQKLRVAHLTGWLQLILALGALSEVLRRYIFGSHPASELMMSIGLLALIANGFCLWLISGHREQGAHMKASWVFSANDLIANFGVILAGLLVFATGSRYPDLIIGLVISFVLIIGALHILRLKA